MASATDSSAPTIPSTTSNGDPAPHEEAVSSDSSLSQNNNHSIRSTPASSFSIQKTSPNTEAQPSGLQPGEDIELSSISRHGNPNENALQPISEESSQPHDTSIVVNGRQDGSGAIHQPPPLDQRSSATTLPESLRTVYRYVPNYQITSNTIALLALILTAFFGYETYRLAKLQAAEQLRESCNEEKAKGILTEICRKVLEHPPGSLYIPEASNITRRAFGLLGPRWKPPIDVSFSQSSISIIHPTSPFLGLITSFSLLIYTCITAWPRDDFPNAVRRLLRGLGCQPNAFDPVIVSLAHSSKGSQSIQGGGRRRVIHGIHTESYGEYESSRMRKRSFQPNFEMLLNVPYWKRRSLGALEMNHKIPAPVRKLSGESTIGQVGDALKGVAPDDLVLSKSTTQSARRLFQKISIFRDSDSDDEIEPPLTALLADPEPEEVTKRNVAITSGVVALGLVQAGATLASSVGGDIGPEILVKIESSDKMEMLTSMPLSPRGTVATGVERWISSCSP